MKTASLIATVALALSLTACSGGDDDVTATDPAPASPSNGAMPTEAPVPAGPVRTLNLATVMDTGTPELCLGPVAESYPPQCGGPEIANWDWKRHGQGMFEQQGTIRWGTFSVTGTWDGTAFEVTETVPGPLYDPAMVEPSEPPAPATDYTEDELVEISDGLRELPGYQASYPADGHVFAEVMYDDGTLQDWVDEEYGESVVLLTSLLVDAE